MKKRIGVSVFLVVVCAAALQAAGDYGASKQGGIYMWNYYFPPAPSTTPWAPAWAPDGKSLAVGMYGSIWQVDPRTGTARELTYDGKYHSEPAWSPDGKWIVFTADDDGRDIQLEILEVATGQVHALTHDNQIYVDPRFSPDGGRLCYVSTQPNGNFNIYVRDIRNGDFTGEAVALTRDNSFPNNRLYFGRWDMHTQPAWTPDGKSIAFVSNLNVPLGSGDLWIMPAESDGVERARKILSEQTLYRTRPDVSPDGNRIVYASTGTAAEEHDQLYVIPIGGGAPYKLTFDPHDHFDPRWSPDGEWIAFLSNEGGLPQLELLETNGGARKRILIQRREWKRPMGKIHVRITDRGALTAARIQYLSPDGKFYPPPEAYARIGFSGLHSFHTTGEFTAEVPPGSISMQVTKGFEYRPVEKQIQVNAGSVTEVSIPLGRMIDMQARGWYSGSTHVHMNYGGNLGNTLANMMMMSRAEGQQMLNVLAACKDNRVLDWDVFVPGGGENPISKGDPNLKVVVGEEYRPPFDGHVFFIGLRDHLISPFTTGYEGTAISSLYPSNTDMLRKAAAEGAVTGYVHPFKGEQDPLEHGLGEAKALPVDAALGTVDVLEWSYANHAEMPVWHRLLNNDFALAPSGGEDSITNLQRDKLIASVRTYVYVGHYFTADSWQQALKKGRTFFTTGPLLDFRINGELPGSVLHLPAQGGEIHVQARAWSISPLTKLVLYHNGQVLRTIPVDSAFDERILVTGSGWYALWAEGPSSTYLDVAYAQAGTNAIRVYVGDQPIRDAQSAEYFLRWLDKLQQMTEAWPWWNSDAEKRHVLSQYEQARQVYRARMETRSR